MKRPDRLLRRFAVTLLIPFACNIALSAGEPDLELIMSDPDWIGSPPSGYYWSDSGDEIYFDQKRIGENFSDRYVVDAAGGEPAPVSPPNESASSNSSRVYNAARTMVAWVHRGDIMVKTLSSGETRQITRTTAEELSPFRSSATNCISCMTRPREQRRRRPIYVSKSTPMSILLTPCASSSCAI
jgi:hypothetical protein